MAEPIIPEELLQAFQEDHLKARVATLAPPPDGFYTIKDWAGSLGFGYQKTYNMIRRKVESGLWEMIEWEKAFEGFTRRVPHYGKKRDSVVIEAE